MTKTEQDTCFAAWLETHAAVLHHVAHGFAEGADRHDLMQELLLAVWRAVPAFRHGAQPATFIYRVAHNAALTWLRSERSYRSRLDQLERDPVHAPPAAEPSISDTRDREALDHLYRAIRAFPPVDRSLLLLHLDGLSYATMAEIHGLTESNVGARLTRSKQKLTRALEAVSHELR